MSATSRIRISRLALLGALALSCRRDAQGQRFAKDAPVVVEVDVASAPRRVTEVWWIPVEMRRPSASGIDSNASAAGDGGRAAMGAVGGAAQSARSATVRSIAGDHGMLSPGR
jgi:hypothetical protein